MQTRSSDKNSVCPPVCLSVCQTRDLWQNERKCTRILILDERAFTLVSWQEEWLVGGGNRVKLTALEQNRRFTVDIRS